MSGAEFLSGLAKDDKLVPVITLTIYWNTGNWDGARSLHEMLNICLDAKLEIKEDAEKGAGNVCKGLEEFWEMTKEAGREEGREEGEARLGRLISILCGKQQFEEVQKVTTDVELRKQYYLEYNL